jgi:AraC family transcriptional regulator of adaptative response/methylated-DNA-[protein]-cysteine methyltransferase
LVNLDMAMARMRNNDYLRIEQAIRYLETHFLRQPGLNEIAASVGLSPFHFQRLFRRWAGISPKRFAQFLTADYAAGLLHRSHTVLETSLRAGLSGAGRLHDLMINIHGMSPGELRQGGAGLTIRYGVHDSPFGRCLLAMTARGVCGLTFVTGEAAGAVAELALRWPGARLIKSPRATRPVIELIFPQKRTGQAQGLDLYVPGTNFQIKVWEALLRIPAGDVSSYGEVAAVIDAPRAARAVGTAIGSNPVAYLIPCHRVIRATGAVGDYHWGSARKHAMLTWEALQVDVDAPAAPGRTTGRNQARG